MKHEKLKDAKKLCNRIEVVPETQLSSQQTQMLVQLHSGLLERNVEDNKAYGHGEGVKITTKEEAAVYRMSCNGLSKFFDR